MGDVVDKLTESWDHTRKSLEDQRRRDEQRGAETVRLEHLKLIGQQTDTRDTSPLARILPEEAARAKAIEASAARKNLLPERDIKEPSSYIHEPGGPKPPDIQGPGDMFGTRRGSQPRMEAQAPVKHLTEKIVQPAELEKISSPQPLPHERLAAKVDRGDLFEVAQARVAAAREIEKLRPREDGSRAYVIESRTR